MDSRKLLCGFVVLAVSCGAAIADINTVGDAGSWFDGADTIAGLGFDMRRAVDSTAAFTTEINGLETDFGSLEWSRPLQVWYTSHYWRPGYDGARYGTTLPGALSIALPDGVRAFDLYVNPAAHAEINISVTAGNGTTQTLTQTVDYDEDPNHARYFGFFSNTSDIHTVTILAGDGSLYGVAIGDLRVAGAIETIPAPGAVLLGGLGFAAAGRFRRRIA